MKKIIVRIEPSKLLSEILGTPYFIERSFTVEELLKNKIITQDDITEMATIGEIQKVMLVRP